MPNPTRPRRATTTGAHAARAAYVAVLLLATLVPLSFTGGGELVAERLVRALLPAPGWKLLVDAVRNLLLFAGWGVVWRLSAPVASPADERDVVRGALLSGALLSVLVEAGQLFSPARDTSVLDLLTNTAGAGLGAAAAAWAVHEVARWRGRPSFLGLPAGLLALPYLLAAGFEAAVPLFLQHAQLGVWGGPLARLAAALTEADGALAAGFSRADLLLFVPAGALGAMSLRERGLPYARAGVLAALAGAGVALLGELVHGMTGYPVVWGALLARALGAALGAGLAAAFLPAWSRRLRGAQRLAAFWTAYAALVLFWAWRPFELDARPERLLADLAPARWVPVVALAREADLAGVAAVGIGFFLFFPVGALLAVWPLRRSGPWRGLRPGLGLAALAALGQALIAGRQFDVTLLCVQLAAVVVGAALARQAGYRTVGQVVGPRRLSRR